jgi:NTE family protein
MVIEGITATSAGTICHCARRRLSGRWPRRRENRAAALLAKVSESALWSIFRPSLIDRAHPSFGLEHSPGYMFMEALSYYSSPYQFNPLNYNPLKTILEEIVNFERVRQQRMVKLFFSATNVQTGKLKIFHGEGVRAEHVLASTCLPLLVQAVEIDGENYWDGGFAGNSPIFPLIYECDARDPKLIDDGKWIDGKRILIHSIESEDVIRELPASSRLNGDWDLLSHLYDTGYDRADSWLAVNFDRVGVESTVDLHAKFF